MNTCKKIPGGWGHIVTVANSILPLAASPATSAFIPRPTAVSFWNMLGAARKAGRCIHETRNLDLFRPFILCRPPRPRRGHVALQCPSQGAAQVEVWLRSDPGLAPAHPALLGALQ